MGFFASKQEKLNKKLMRACSNGQMEEIRLLLTEGADANAKDSGGSPPLFYAIYSDQLEAAQALIAKGADLGATDSEGITPLIEACRRGKKDFVSLFIGLGCDIHAKSHKGLTALHHAAERPGTEFEPAVQMLLEKGADIHARANDGQTPLHRAAACGRFNIIQLLLAAGANAHAMDNQGNKPEDRANENGRRGAASFLQKVTAQVPLPLGAKDGWQLTAPDEIVFTAEKPAVGYCLTEIFNFNARLYTQIARNLKSGAESQAVRFFDEFPDKKILEQAHQQLLKLGGKAAASAIYSATLNKNPQ